MSIEIDSTGSIFKVATRRTCYIFGKEAVTGYLGHYYYGKIIRDLDAAPSLIRNYGGASFAPWSAKIPYEYSRSTTMQECTTFEYGDVRTASVAVRNADGTECTDPQYKSYRVFKGVPEIKGMPHARLNGDEAVETLEITLADPCSRVEFLLYYTAFPAEDVIVRSMKVVNRGDAPVQITRAMSFCLDLPHSHFDLLHTPGGYGRERHAERAPLHRGVQGFFSKRSSSGHDYNPAFALAAHHATETAGDVYGAILVYSGSFAAEIEADAFGRTRAVMGINPDVFEWKLAPGEEFETPQAFLTFSAEGVGGMSRNFHDMLREHLISPRWAHEERPILVNNWEATYFNFDREKLLSIARDAAELGIEMLVLDDGWFGHRECDNSSLGDWVVNEKKIGSLGTLAEEINRLGVQFGLWFEPEMISPDSDLYRRHPEWVFTVPGREPTIARSQYILNMALSEVVDYVFNAMASVLRSANIRYVKWDMNRQPAEKFLPGFPADQQLEASHRYVLGVYALHQRLLDEFPELFIEGCSGGGGRFDAGMLYYAPQIWCSDDTDALVRLAIQGGTSLFYPCSTHGAHVSVCPCHMTGGSSPFATRGMVALAGTFGYELDLNKLSTEDRELVKVQTKLFHQLHHLVTNGDFYRLTEGEEAKVFTAWEFAAKDQSEAFAISVFPTYPVSDGMRVLRFRGLNPARQYQIEGTDKVFYGDSLMDAGLPLEYIPQGGYSAICHLISK